MSRINYFILILIIVGCNSSKVILKSRGTLLTDENEIISSVSIQNCTMDTLYLEKPVNFFPLDKEKTRYSLELFRKDGGTLDTIASNDFDFAIIPDFLEEDFQLYAKLLPSKTYNTELVLSSFYGDLPKGKYVLKVCLKRFQNNDWNTCNISKFKLNEDFSILDGLE